MTLSVLAVEGEDLIRVSLARGVVREPVQAFPGQKDSTYRGRLRLWNAHEIKVACVAMEAYRGRRGGVSQRKSWQIGRHHRCSAAPN